jgi:8-oxo-dGTP pyrophosphatase MutT (NUDIX family)
MAGKWGRDRRSSVTSWKVLASSYSFADRFLKLRTDTVLLPDGSVLTPYHVLEFCDWVCVIAIRRDGQVVLVEEYRHGAGRPMMEFPSGGVAEGDKDPLAAMQRELLEETGYSGGTWHALGAFFGNSAQQSNRTHCFLALGVERTGAPQPGPGELLTVHEVPWREFAAEAYGGGVELNAGHMSCLFLLQRFVADSTDAGIRNLLK